jgi:hypothetical protein
LKTAGLSHKKKNQKEQTFKKGRRSIQRKTGKERM